ncbi:MAG: potassium transporter TrkG [bacterium]
MGTIVVLLRFAVICCEPGLVHTFHLGGLGFAVIVECLNWHRGHPLSLHSRLVLKTTAILIVFGTLFILLVEGRNPATLADASWKTKVLASYFQAVTPRTAGFNTLPISALRPATLLLIMLFMFIGASPGGTGGGIKTTTFVTLLLTVMATVRGKERTEVGGRCIPAWQVAKSMAIAFISLCLILGATTVLLLSEGKEFLPTLFEVVSAFGTVGLTMGLTTELSVLGRLVITAVMFAGRVGPLTMVLALAHQQYPKSVRFPEESIIVG